MPTLHWQVLPDAQSVAQAACEYILRAAEQAIKARGVFRLVLAGGSTPERAYRLLAGSTADWTHWHIYYGDERCLPPEHDERNSYKAQRAWLTQVPIPLHQQYPIPAEQGAKMAALMYAHTLSQALPFDLTLLGLGEDGHTASLFPGHRWESDALTQAVLNAPKAPPQRVSLSPTALGQSREIVFLVTGANKREAVQAWRAGAALPAAQVAALAPTLVLLDQVSDGDVDSGA